MRIRTIIAASLMLALGVMVGGLTQSRWGWVPHARQGDRPRHRPGLDHAGGWHANDASTDASDATAVVVAPVVPRVADPEWATVRAIIAGGGATPELNQIEIALDLALAREAFGSPAWVLFSSGPGARVQVRDDPPRGDSLIRRLAELFSDHAGRDAHYAAAPIAPHGEGTAERVVASLRAALAVGDAPLVMYLAAHGEKGDHPFENRVGLWGDTEITVDDFVRALEAEPTRRMFRVVMTSCHAGGFAEMVFRGAREANGPSDAQRCGLFATLWDLEASGCDSNPDRRAHENYGLHFLQALRGLDRDGHPVGTAAIDLDHDGRVGLSEAHAYARIHARSIDVPTSTSERWLRSQVPTAVGMGAPTVALRDDDAVIAELSRTLGVANGLAAAQSTLDATDDRLHAVNGRIDALQEVIDGHARRTRAALLARWPVLDDPWHPDWTTTVRDARGEIQAQLDHDPGEVAAASVRDEQSRAANEAEPLEVRAALLERLVRAYENRSLAAVLRARGGRGWQVFERLRACEGAPVSPPAIGGR